MIYADNAATTKLSAIAFETMKSYLIEDFSNPSQPYSFSRNSKKAIKESRMIIADCIGAEPNEIFFTSGGTESDNWAIKCFGKQLVRKSVITSEIEHHAILNACESIKADENISYLSVNRCGLVDADELEMFLVSEGVNDLLVPNCLVSIMLANNEIGTIQDIKGIANLTHQYGALFHTDAVQAIGHIPIDVKKLGVDMLSASAHKFNGPKGIGFLYVKNGVEIHPFHNGGGQESFMRAGTENVAGIVGMATALKENCSNIQKNATYLNELENRFLNSLKEHGIDFIRNGYENHLPGNVSISIKNSNGEMLLHRLDLMGICISTGSACDSVNNQISHVIKAIRVPKEYAEGTIRISFSYENTPDEVDEISNAIAKIVL